MFQNMPAKMRARMRKLEAIDATERQERLPASERLCAVPPETGRLLALLAASAPAGEFIEIGTSSGYSTLWLICAAAIRGHRVQTFECASHKILIAQETFSTAEVTDLVGLIHGDVRRYLPNCRNVAFCFMDHAKELYAECYEMLVPNLVAGGLLVIDNILSHHDILAPFIAQVMADTRVDAATVPIGKGILLTRKI
ncbi:Methyltransferase [Gammaproteobacteria bacterium]